VEVSGEAVVGQFTGDLEYLRERKGQQLFEEYANWPGNPQDVLRFRRYGPLEQSWYRNGGFRFSLKAWQSFQEGFRREWEHFLEPLNNYTRVGFFPRLEGALGWEYDPAAGLRYTTANLWEYLQLSLMACPKERLKKCARPECAHPYFVAHHLKQNYCSDQCPRWAQQQWKRQWWSEHGNKWRAKRRRMRSSAY
jgi:hypothetical protein